MVVIPSGYYKKDTVFVNDTDDGVDQYHFVYGQEIFSSSAQAQAGGIPQVPDWFKYTLRLAGVMVQSGSSTIKSIIDLRPKLGQYVSTTAAIITNHEDLVGLLGGKAGEHYHFNYDDYVARELQTNKNIANGYVGLDSLTLISASELGTGPNTSDSILFGNRTWKSLSGNLDVRYVTTSSFSSSVQLIGDNRYLLTASIPDQRITGSVILSGNLAVAGFRTGYKEVLATYTLVRDDFFIRADATSASFGITLPTAIGVSGKQYSIKKVDSTINEITLSSSLSQKIDDDVKMIIDSQWSSISVISDGTRWLIF